MARPPSTSTPPSQRPVGQPRPPRSGRGSLWTRAATLSVLRLGVLIGGLVIITDLLFLALGQRTVNPDDAATFDLLDQIINWVLFGLLGVLVVRDTDVFFAGAVAGLFASLLDAAVVAAATIMGPQPPPLDAVRDVFITNLVIGTVFAGTSGVVYALVQRWSGGRRPR